MLERGGGKFEGEMPGGEVTATEIKWIALLTMFADHVGAVLFPQLSLLRIIGRISFPLYVFLLVEGFAYTGSRGRYLFRLLLLALVSEIPFDTALLLPVGDVRSGILLSPERQNVMWTLVLGFLYMAFYEWLARLLHALGEKKTPANPLRERVSVLVVSLFAAAFLILLANLAVTDYKGYGVAAIVACFLVKKWGAPYWLMLVAPAVVLQSNPSWNVEIFAVAVAPLLLCYKGRKGRSLPKFFFYAAYPAHLAVLAVIRILWKL